MSCNKQILANKENHPAVCRCSLAVERLLRKQKVVGSIPIVGFFSLEGRQSLVNYLLITYF